MYETWNQAEIPEIVPVLRYNKNTSLDVVPF